MWAWVYTSWYWYTCNIKWFCDGFVRYEIIAKAENIQQNTLSWSNQRETRMIWWEDEIISRTFSGNTLSAEDVLSVSPTKNTWDEDIQQEVKVVDEQVPQTGSGTLLEALMWDESTKDTFNNEISVADICSVPLVGPIWIGNANNENEVRRLEAFLNSQGESLQVNGIYELSDVAAVNKFQLKYKAKILDPWGITNPTWYVFRTTVSTMNSIACWEDISG